MMVTENMKMSFTKSIIFVQAVQEPAGPHPDDAAVRRARLPRVPRPDADGRRGRGAQPRLPRPRQPPHPRTQQHADPPQDRGPGEGAAFLADVHKVCALFNLGNVRPINVARFLGFLRLVRFVKRLR